MHSWDVMPSSNNYDHNWYGLQIKSESTQDIMTSYQNMHQSSGAQLDSSPGTSPQNIDGENIFFEGYPNRQLGFNPLTPPGYTGAVLTQSHIKNNNQIGIQNTPCRNFNKTETHIPAQTTLTPSHTPPMDVTPPKSPKPNDETPEKETESLSLSENFMDSGDERSIESDYEEEGGGGKPGRNGKPKKYKCKQCDYVAVTKQTFWEHTKAHMKPEKMLKCPKCPFVTEYKHHLEYHLRNHDGSKPFQCPNCNYSCVNKSMLNSHLKSHSNIYQYRCKDCNYATKYCHSLKLHLRKYAHKPAMVLNSDGTPNPLPIIDVYGTRRGPKTRPTKAQQQIRNQERLLQQQQQQQQQMLQKQLEEPSQSIQSQRKTSNDDNHQSNSQQIPNLISSMLPNSIGNMLHPGNLGFPYLNFNLHMLAVRQQQVLSQLSPKNVPESNHNTSMVDEKEIHGDHNHITNNNNINNSFKYHLKKSGNNSALDLTQPNQIENDDSHGNMMMILTKDEDDDDYDEDEDEEKIPTSTSCGSAPSTPSIVGSKNRRKGQAFKLNLMKDCPESDEDSSSHISKQPRRNEQQLNDDTNNHQQHHHQQQQQQQQQAQQSTHNEPTSSQSKRDTQSYECKFCDISFGDAVLYTIHMGYHGYNDVFKCNMCGEKCDDRIAFFLHIARNPHN